MHAHDQSTTSRELVFLLVVALLLTASVSLAVATSAPIDPGDEAALPPPTTCASGEETTLLGEDLCVPTTTTTAAPTTTTTVATTTTAPPPPPPRPAPRPVRAAAARPAPAPQAAPAPAPPPAATPVLDTAAEGRLRALLSARRHAIGQPDFAGNGTLTDCARRWSYRMAADGRLNHSSSGGEDCAARVWSVCACSGAAENVGQAATADRIWNLWMASGAHLSNIDHAGGGIVGIGVYRYNGSVWATMVFGYAS